MSESEVIKVNTKHRYPWSELQIGESFIIPSTNEGGTNYHRQLVYAAIKALNVEDFQIVLNLL